MPFSVVYDACVLYSAPVRDLLMRIAAAGIVQARWSDQILDECFRSIQRERPDVPTAALERTRKLMTTAIPSAMVTNYQSLVGGITLPDANDRHVLAAAIRSGAQAIVTYNLGDFPHDTLRMYDVEPKHPDEFLLDCLDLAPALVVTCLAEQAAALQSPPRTVRDVLDTLRDRGLVQAVARINEMMSGTVPASLADTPESS